MIATRSRYATEATVSKRLGFSRPATVARSESLLSVRPDAWKRAYRFALANAILFTTLSWTQYVLEPASVAAILWPPAVFFVGAMMSFVLLVRSGGTFAAIAWFILGAGIYFGLGVVVGSVAPDPRSLHSASASVLLSDILRINILNSSSIVLVLTAAIPLAYTPKPLRITQPVGTQQIANLLEPLFPAMAIMAIIAMGLQIMFFPVASNLLVRTFLSSVNLTIPFCLLTLGMLRTRLQVQWIVMGTFVFLLAFALSLLTMSKLSVMSNVAALVVGSWVYRRTLWSIARGLLIVAAVYAYTGTAMNSARNHADYDAVDNSPLTRIAILGDTVLGKIYAGGIPEGDSDSALPGMLMRVSMNDVQAYLIAQYDSRQPGSSLNDFWAAAVPRLFWPDKPIITRFGTELHEQFWAIANASSALAPTYTAEAYWNWGALGVLVVSILLGLELGWLTQRWHIAIQGLDPAFFVIAFPAALWASYVESWIAANYIGGFLTIAVLWCVSRCLFRLFADGPALATPVRTATNNAFTRISRQ